MLTFNLLNQVATKGAGWAVQSRLQPVAGEGAIIFPPTYAGGVYNLHPRKIDQQTVPCVVLNSVQSEANAIEQAIEQALDSGLDLFFPQIKIQFDQLNGLVLSTGMLPHRCTDSRLRDSDLDKVPYRDSDIGKAILDSQPHNLTGLFLYDPRAILFGCWDSFAAKAEQTKRQKTRMKLQLRRLLLAEITGVGIVEKNRKFLLSDPLQFSASLPLEKDPYYKSLSGVSKGLKPSEVGLSAVINSNDNLHGGVSMDYALYETYFSCAELRKYKFPYQDKSSAQLDEAVRTLLTAMSVLAQALRFEQGFSLRSGCDLILEEPPKFVFKGRHENETLFEGEITAAEAYSLYEKAYAQVRDLGLKWESKTYLLTPNKSLQGLIEKNLVETE
jgi:CRISPR-associated protein Csb1